MLSTREGRTHGVLLEKSQEQSGSYSGLTTLVNLENPSKRDHALPVLCHKPQRGWLLGSVSVIFKVECAKRLGGALV